MPVTKFVTEEAEMSETTTWTVTGMTCGHCVASVTEELSELPGVERVDVDRAVREAGYQLS
jgi:copper chaperone CopZ